MEYRLYFLDAQGHVIGRAEFVAADDTAALRIGAVLCEESSDQHAGYMLWQAARQIFATDDGGDPALIRALAAKPLSEEAQQIVLAVEERLLGSRWPIAQSQRLLIATSRARRAQKLAS